MLQACKVHQTGPAAKLAPSCEIVKDLAREGADAYRVCEEAAEDGIHGTGCSRSALHAILDTLAQLEHATSSSADLVAAKESLYRLFSAVALMLPPQTPPKQLLQQVSLHLYCLFWRSISEQRLSLQCIVARVFPACASSTELLT